ncbi:LysR family transcriptional regulator substrate-binding protein, partial [Veillonella sp. R32]|uniref:LysR family transcriptional regulator substrate-binding protein n=1 Tax=Veillonella sp. R32 TaxID=2021312 RepID=UPI00138A3BD9
FCPITPEFNEAYPNVTVELTMENSPILREKLLSDNLDLAIGLFDTPPVELNHKLLYKDQCYLCISERLLDKYFSQTTKEILKKRNIQGVDLKSFEELPIFLMNSANHIGHIIQQLFLESGIKPDLYMSTKSDSLGPPLCSAGVAASFITHSRLLFEWNTIASDINIFPVMFHKSPLYFDLYLISPQNSRFPKYQLYFTKLILNYVQRLNLNPLSRII